MTEKSNSKRILRERLGVVSGIMEYMTGGRIGVAPDAIPDLLPWILVLRSRYDKMARFTLRGYTGKARILRRGQQVWGEMMVRAFDELVRSLGNTISMEEYERAHAALAIATSGSAESEPVWPSSQE